MRKSLAGPAYVMHSVDHALRLLSLFAERRRLRVRDIVRDLDVAPATASRLVTMLEHHGYVQRDTSTRGYVVGRRLRQIGYSAIEEFDIGAPVRACLEDLAAETGETAQFAVLQGSTIVFLDCAESRHHLRVASHTGTLLPAHALSSGKVLLAALAPDQLAALYPDDKLPRVTAKTIGTRRRLFAEIDRVRCDGFAASTGESDDAIFSVAAAVRDALGRVRGALSVAAPVSRSGERARRTLVRAVRTGAADLSARIA
jgi:DNA-binding IclR family transcriptional regulator